MEKKITYVTGNWAKIDSAKKALPRATWIYS